MAHKHIVPASSAAASSKRPASKSKLASSSSSSAAAASSKARTSKSNTIEADTGVAKRFGNKQTQALLESFHAGTTEGKDRMRLGHSTTPRDIVDYAGDRAAERVVAMFTTQASKAQLLSLRRNVRPYLIGLATAEGADYDAQRDRNPVGFDNSDGKDVGGAWTATAAAIEGAAYVVEAQRGIGDQIDRVIAGVTELRETLDVRLHALTQRVDAVVADVAIVNSELIAMRGVIGSS